MKKLLILNSVLASAAFSAIAQGTIDASNNGTGVLICIQDPALTSSPVKIGTSAVAAGYYGAGPGEVSFTLYAALNGTSLSSLQNPQNIIASGYNSPLTLNAFSGIEFLGQPLTLPTQVGFDGSQPLEFIFYGVDASGKYSGWSSEATNIFPTPSGVPGFTQIFGTAPGEINSFVLTETALPLPEPSTVAIAGIGVAALALFGRRKSQAKV